MLDYGRNLGVKKIDVLDDSVVFHGETDMYVDFDCLNLFDIYDLEVKP